ncbi:hypothetical protein Ddye_001238 [Dipteronia dyeriana]|uniref:Uncharacterized protein n=1 Tax=Dipteronia dyeriana TaxID=168575 RepID=A0AAE0CTC1_9ROSI|nr:hypothetical protein Ddye_001238 [Dipteronia dyeriana]
MISYQIGGPRDYGSDQEQQKKRMTDPLFSSIVEPERTKPRLSPSAQPHSADQGFSPIDFTPVEQQQQPREPTTKQSHRMITRPGMKDPGAPTEMSIGQTI